jgi:hypothetical protein
MNVDRGVGEPFRLCTTTKRAYIAALLRGVILLDVQKVVVSAQVPVAGVGTSGCQPRAAAEPCPWREWSTKDSESCKCPLPITSCQTPKHHDKYPVSINRTIAGHSGFKTGA